jgi:hypothetical protein
MTTASPASRRLRSYRLPSPPPSLSGTAMSRGSGRLTLHARFGYKPGQQCWSGEESGWIGQAAYADDGPEVAIWGRSDRHI